MLILFFGKNKQIPETIINEKRVKDYIYLTEPQLKCLLETQVVPYLHYTSEYDILGKTCMIYKQETNRNFYRKTQYNSNVLIAAMDKFQKVNLLIKELKEGYEVTISTSRDEYWNIYKYIRDKNLYQLETINRRACQISQKTL